MSIAQLTKNVEIVRQDVMIGVGTPVPPLYVCEFYVGFAISSIYQKQKQKKS